MTTTLTQLKKLPKGNLMFGAAKMGKWKYMNEGKTPHILRVQWNKTTPWIIYIRRIGDKFRIEVRTTQKDIHKVWCDIDYYMLRIIDNKTGYLVKQSRIKKEEILEQIGEMKEWVFAHSV